MNKESGSVSSMLTESPDPIKSFSLKLLADGQVTVRDDLVGETFHPVIGAMNEARQLYVDQTFLRDCWNDPQTVQKTVWDVGLGAAANAVATYDAWSKGSFGDFFLQSFDHSLGALSFALEQRKQHPESLAHLEGWDWEKLMKEGHLSIRQGERTFTWTFHKGDFLAICRDGNLRKPDLIMYDLYSPPKCPELYSLPHFEFLRKCVDGKETLLVLHTRSTVVRVTLALAGWYVGAGTRLGDKEETTLATNRKDLLAEPLGPEWLRKVKRSTSASPILDGTMRIGPISSDWLSQLENHSQWAKHP